jgi:sugar diacid utilization regulator
MAEAERRLAAFGIRAAAVADQLIVHRNTVRYRWSRSSG